MPSNIATFQRGRSLLWVFLFLVAGYFVHGCMEYRETPVGHVDHPETGFAFPKPSDIEKILVTHVYDQPDFEVPQSFWPDILDALSPSERDLGSEPWASLAGLSIQLKGGRGIRVVVYDLSESPVGAFSAGAGHSYCGGNTNQFMETLDKAYAAYLENSKNKEEPDVPKEEKTNADSHE